ncbi:MAG TPA: hypothetical protein VH985_05010 [Candidatus Binatia bacterium]
MRVYQSPNTPAVVVVPESQAERILSDETDLLKPEDVFAALAALPEPHTLKSVVLLDERDEYARTVEHPKWPAAHKSFGDGGEVCFHGVSKRDDVAAILNYHWAIQHQLFWERNTLYWLATKLETGLDLRDEDEHVDWATHMAGDILTQDPNAFEGFAAQAPLRTVALCRGLQAAVAVEGAPPLADWLARRMGYAETTVRAAARRRLVETAMTVGHKWPPWERDNPINLLLAYGEEEDFRSFAKVTTVRIINGLSAPENTALLKELISLEECDLSYQRNDPERWLRQLAQCPNLKILNLYGSSVMGSALAALPLFQSLTDLDLTDTLIFDNSALCYLIAAKRLQRLNISRTGITEDGIASLKRALPSCEIITGP